MNNSWRLLLLAVVALLQPIASFTEGPIDGPQECCDHRSNSIPQDTRPHGSYRKASEDRRLNREDFRGARRDERHVEPIIRSRVRLALERAERRISPEAAIRSAVESRIARDQDRRQRILSDAREPREIRNEENRRARENHSRDVLSQNKNDRSDTSRIRASRDERRIARFGIERMLRDSRETHRTRNLEELRRVSPNRDTMAVLKRERGDVTRKDVQLGSGNPVFRSESKLQLDNKRERRAIERRASERRSLPVDSRQVNNEQEMRLSRQTSRAERSRISKTAYERANERREQDQHRESRDRTSTTIRDSRERISDERGEFRDTSERADENKRGIRNNERRDERRQQSESLKARDTLTSRLQESSARNDAQRRYVAGDFARYSRTAIVNAPSERITKSHGVMDERELSRDRTVETLRISRGTAAERQQESRVARISQMLETTTRVEKLTRNNERNRERRETRDFSIERAKDSRDSRVSRIPEFRDENLARNNKRSDTRREFARASVLPESRDSRSADREYNSRDTTRFSRDLKRDIRDERTIRIHRDVRNAEILDERRQNHDGSRLSRDRTLSELRPSRDSVDRIQEYRRIIRNSQSERSTIFERESRDRANERVNVNRHGNQERSAISENSERKSRDTERRNGLELSRNSPLKERAYFNEHDSGNREDIRSNERFEARRETRHENREFRDRTVVLQRLSRIATSPQQNNDIRRTKRTAAASTRVERALEDIRDNERREVRRFELLNNRASRERSFTNEFTRDRITAESRQGKRETTRDSRDLNEVSRNRETIRTGVRYEVRRQERQPSKERLALQRGTQVTSTDRSMARHQDISSRSERNIRNERTIRDISGRINERPDRSDSRNYRTTESRRETRWMTDREIKTNRYNLVMERMVNHASNAIRTEASIRYDALIGKDERMEANTRDTKYAAIVNRFRNIPFDKNRDLDSVEEQSENEVFYLNWRMVIYTLHGAYLCGLLMQMMTEKSTTGKRRNFAWWSSTRELLKID